MKVNLWGNNRILYHKTKYIYLAKPKSGASQFRPRPVNNMLFFLLVFVYLHIFLALKTGMNRFAKQSTRTMYSSTVVCGVFVHLNFIQYYEIEN